MTGATNRVVNSLRREGVVATFGKLRAATLDIVFDLWFGVDTRAWRELDGLTIAGENRARGRSYQATRVIALRRLFETLRPIVGKDSVFVDLGCGKGRVLLIAAESGFKAVRGVEFAREICDIAKKNCAVYRRRRGIETPVTVTHADAARYPIDSDEDVFFMFNPFDDVVMRQVLDNIRESCLLRPRKVLVVQHRVSRSTILDQHPYFESLGRISLAGSTFSLHSNAPANAAANGVASEPGPVPTSPEA